MTIGRTRIAFVVFGVHKDGLKDPMGTPFIDDQIVARSAEALEGAGIEVERYPLTISTKEEARRALSSFKCRDDVHALVLFSGTWVWAAHMTAAVRDFSASGKAIVIWTHPGSQGWRPVGGLVLHGALKEIGIEHRSVYGAADDPQTLQKIASYCRASNLRLRLNMSTVGVFGGRGMGQSCGVADPSQWMRLFGIDIDSRDTLDLVRAAESVEEAELAEYRKKVSTYFENPLPTSQVADRSIRLLAAIRKLVEAEKWDFYTIQSFPGIADHFSATCLAQSMMMQWGTPTSTLSDFNTLLSVILLMGFSEEPVYYGDLQHFDVQTNEIKIIGDGMCPPSLAGKAGPARFAEHGIPTEGEAGGVAVDLVCKSGKGLLVRVGRAVGTFEVVAAPCTVFEPPQEQVRKRREECHIPFWPHAFVTVQSDMHTLIESWNNEYAVLGYGEHLYGEVEAFCRLTGLRFVPV